MKICFLGAASVGKTTFVSALLNMAESYPRFYAPFKDAAGNPNSAVKDIQKDAETLARGGSVPATTMIRKVYGLLLQGENEGVEIEFIDLPGSLFTQGYLRKDLNAIKSIRDFVLTSDYLFFFFEPDDFEQNKGERVRTFMEVLQDYYDVTGSAKIPHVTLVLTKADLCPQVYMRGKDCTNPEDVRKYMAEHSDGAIDKLIKMAHGEHCVSFAAISTRSSKSPLVLSAADFKGLFQDIFVRTHARIQATRRAKIVKRGLLAAGIVLLSATGIWWCINRPTAPSVPIPYPIPPKPGEPPHPPIIISLPGTPEQIENQKIEDYNTAADKLKKKENTILTKDNFKGMESFFTHEFNPPSILGKEDLKDKARKIWEKLKNDYRERLLNSEISRRREELKINWDVVIFNEFLSCKKEYEEHFHTLPNSYDLPETLREYHSLRRIANISAGSHMDKVCARISAIKEFLAYQSVLHDSEVSEIHKALDLGTYLSSGKLLTVDITANCDRIHKKETYWFSIDKNCNSDQAENKDKKTVKAEKDKSIQRKVLISWNFGDDIAIRLGEFDNWRSGLTEHLRGVIKYASRPDTLSSLCGSSKVAVTGGDWKGELTFTTKVFKGDAIKRSSGAVEITKEDMAAIKKYLLDDTYWEGKVQETKPQ